MNMTAQYKVAKLSGKEFISEPVPSALVNSVRSKFTSNYFGLPPYSVSQSAESLAYKSRAPLDNNKYEDSEEHSSHQHLLNSDKTDTAAKKNMQNSIDLPTDNNYTAQRKVAKALLTMVSNDIMIRHFLFKGGLDAVLKLVQESKDLEVLQICASCLIQSSTDHGNCKVLIDRNIFGALQTLIDIADDQMKHSAANIIANLSGAPEKEELLVQHGMLGLIQALNSHVHRTDTMCFILLSLSNISPAITMTEYAEQVVRLCFLVVQKLDVMKNFNKALFVSDMYCNFSRLANYSSLLVEEGVLPLLMHLMDSHLHDDILRRCTETLANLSMNRKNRREIASSGIASRLQTLFNTGSTATRSSTLLIVGNLLSSGLFHDKVANHATIGNILDKLFDLSAPSQFNGVCYCLCQLSKVQSSCSVMVDCNVIPLLLQYIRKTPEESLDYMWMLLTNITSYPIFFDELVVGSGAELLEELYEEVRYDTSKLNRRKAVVKIGLNISKRPDLCTYLSQPLIYTFVSTMKLLFSSRLGTETIQMSALVTLINLNYHCREARATTLGTDLIDLFQTVGLDDDKMNVKYAGLLNVISNEEACCYKLLDLGVHKLLVALQESFHRLTAGGVTIRSNQKSFKKGQSIKNMTNVLASTSNTASSPFNQAASIKIVANKTRGVPLQDPNYEYEPAVEGELGKELTAATLHNLAIKRSIVTPGVLLVLLGLARNCKTLRVLHCIRSLAHMSAHPKAKVMLNKEARKILPMLTVSMRCGCEEAERVQHYCAITLCNMLAAPLEKGLLVELVGTGAIVDLVVVTLLRINSVQTKETLGRAFFNLLNRTEIREALVMKLDIISAILELSKIEYIELLELCMHAMYNITCELRPGTGYEDGFASKLLALKVPRFIIARLVYTPAQEGSIGTRAIRFLLGKSMANMSFNKQLVVEFTNEQGTKVADALHRVFVLKNDESTYCACATLFNLSGIEECRMLSESGVLHLIVEMLANECPALCIKLCAATLCNFSMMSVFHEKLSLPEVMATIVMLLGSPQMAMSIKKDALQAVYNLVTMYTPSRAVFVSCGGVTALWKVLKVKGGGGLAGMAGGGGSKGENEERSLNVSRAMRGFCFSPDECKVLVKQERFLPVFKSLIKSKNEDVLWQTAGVMYNLMGVEYCLKILLERSLVSLIFEIASSGYASVKHVCSACLHMIPDHMPNMEDPVVLELVLCLLEAEGGKFSELGNKPDDNMPYNMVEPCYGGTALKHTGTDFKALWTHQSCEVDNVFTPTLMFTPSDHNLDSAPPTLDASTFSFLSPHSKLRTGDYQDFRKEADGGLQRGGTFASMDGHDLLEGSSVSAPQPSVKVPPGHQHHPDGRPMTEEEYGDDFEQDERLRRQEHDAEINKLHNIMVGTKLYPKEGASNSSTGSGGSKPSLRMNVNMLATMPTSRSLGSHTGAGGATSRSHSHLPAIASVNNNPPRMPDNTVGALLDSIHHDAKKHQRAPGIPQLSMSSSLDSSSISLMDKQDDLRHQQNQQFLHQQQQQQTGGKSRGSSSRADSRPLPDLNSRERAPGGAQAKVVQISVNNHGNFAR
eukprot:gene13724-15786_t